MTILLALVLLFVAAPLRADDYLRQPALDVVHYEISLELTDASDSIAGTTRVHVMMSRDGVSEMWLDFSEMSVDKLLIGGKEQAFVHRDGRLSFQLGRTYSRHEIAVVEVRFHGRPARKGMLIGKNSYGRRVFFSDNWPDRAHYWFPCIDHPSDKATVEFAVTAPQKYDVVSNGRLVETRALTNGRRLTRWSERSPIPTYCMVVGAAEFDVAHQDSAGIPVIFYSYSEDTTGAIQKFARSQMALQYFAGLFGPYPYEKLAQVESTTGIGAMENASAIFYAESSFQHTPVPEPPVPHEIAHQWFGDSVTEADWDHLWLSEGFATYLEALFYEHVEGPDALKRIMAQGAERVKQYSKNHPAAIVNPQMNDPTKKLNPLNYEKGAWVLHMLRKVLGDELFFQGLRTYYSIYAGGNALTEDFQKVMESVSGTQLKTFFRQWLYQPAWPEYKVRWRWEARTNEVEITVRQLQTTGLFDMPLDIAIRSGQKREMHTIRVAAETDSFKIPLESAPSIVELDPDNWVLKTVAP